MKSEIDESINPTKRGGRRPGAGRKPNYFKRLRDPVTAAMILAQIDENQTWKDLINNKQPKIRLEALKYLTDRRDGKAPQTVLHASADTSRERAREIIARANLGEGSQAESDSRPN